MLGEIVTRYHECQRAAENPQERLLSSVRSHERPGNLTDTARRLRNRIKLEEYNTVDDAVSLIRASKKIMILTGAGVSVSSFPFCERCIGTDGLG